MPRQRLRVLPAQELARPGMRIAHRSCDAAGREGAVAAAAIRNTGVILLLSTSFSADRRQDFQNDAQWLKPGEN